MYVETAMCVINVGELGNTGVVIAVVVIPLDVLCGLLMMISVGEILSVVTLMVSFVLE
jgi:hypothetical protein